ncbi:MAG TPA: HEAT repeat domain-containing protein [Alphaproteobacteria bacterium]|nr:HEAT repeat domain-containing protein [Alphaproteobacteria bacterium]
MDRDSWDQPGRYDSAANAPKNPQATEAFLAEFATLDLASQRQKIRELCETEEENYSENHAPIYAVVMNHPDPEVRRCAVEAMWYYPDEAYLDRILNVVWFDSDEEVRGRAAMVLGRYMYEGFVMEELDESLAQRVKRILFELSTDERESITVRRFALEALSFCTDDPKVLNLIEQGYFSPDQRMQLSALFAMGRSGLERWHGYLLRALHESEKEFRIEAICACGEAQIISAVPELQKMCFDMDRDIRLEAIWALGKIGDERALHTLQRCTRDADPEVCEIAHDAIEELGIAAAIARGEYEEAMDDEDLGDPEGYDEGDWDDEGNAEDDRE